MNPQASTARLDRLRAVLDHVCAGDLDGAAALGARHGAETAWDAGISAFAHHIGGDPDGVVRWAGVALAADPDPVERLLALGALGLGTVRERTPMPETWAEVVPEQPGIGDPFAAAAAHLATLDDAGWADDAQWFAAYVALEAAVSANRMDIALTHVTALTPHERPLYFGGIETHPFSSVIGVAGVRALSFSGRVDEAVALVSRMRARDGVVGMLRRGADVLVRGSAADAGAARRLADELEALVPVPRGAIEVGAWLLAGYGLQNVGDVQRAAACVIRAGGDADLSQLGVVDRPFGIELLVTDAIAAADLDAAVAWRQRVEPLVGHPLADSSVSRVIARVELASGHVAVAIDWADRSIEQAVAAGRYAEAALGQLVAAEARVAASRPGEASARLEEFVAVADAHGHRAVRRQAARALRSTGRRLRPPPGSELAGLSDRERRVAELIAAGRTNEQIAADLHVSPHTVRAHVSRVLAAFGVSTRGRVAARIGELLGADVAAAPLSPRQRSVAELVGAGCANAEIAARLGISVKTVEKHVGDVMRRWNVPSRAAVARVVSASRGRAE